MRPARQRCDLAGVNRVAQRFVSTLRPPVDLWTQSERCSEVLLARHRRLLAQLSGTGLLLLQEAASPIGRHCVNSIYFAPNLELVDFDLSAALHIRLMVFNTSNSCHSCHRRAHFSHFYACVSGKRHCTDRHDAVKNAIAHNLAPSQTPL